MIMRMSTFASDTTSLAITGVRFEDNRVYLALDDGREISLPLTLRGLRWLKEASPEQRTQWKIDEDGQAVIWQDLQDGIEIDHLLKYGRLA
jgi:hypothetical protein